MTNQILANPVAHFQQGYSNALRTGAQAQQLRAQQQDMERQNALRQLYEQQGAGIAQGDQNALAALARIDPMAAAELTQKRNALDIDRQNLDLRKDEFGLRQKSNDFDAARLDMARKEAKRAATEHAAKMSAAERQQEITKITDGLKGAIRFYEAGDEQGYNQYIQSLGVSPEEAPFEQFPAVAAQYDGVLGALKEVQELGAGPKPADEYQRYVQEEQSAGRKPLNRIEYAQAKKGEGTTVFDPATGMPIYQSGGASAGPPKMTVDAAKNSGFLVRTNEANKVLNDLEDQGTRFAQQNLDKVPLGLGNYGRDQEFQRFDQARRDFVNAILRRESGAVISDAEFDNANKQYFPVPGDTPEVIKQKRRNRETAIEGLRIGSGEGAAYVDRLEAERPAQPSPAASPTYESFDAFAASADVQAKAQEYGVSVQDMWAILQGGE